jgi:hypothetical protein
MLLAAALVVGPALGVVAAVSITYVQVDRNGPPKAWGKGAGDLNGNGRADLVVGSVVGGLYWYQNPGWTKRVISAGIRTQEDLEVIDLDKDGTHNVAWYKNPGSGNGTWARRAIESGVQSVVHFTAIVDFDGDGRNDVTTAMTHRGTNPKIKLYYNEDGSGSFSAPDIVAKASSHMMQIVNVGGKMSLFEADYDDAGNTSIDLWQIGSATNNPPAGPTAVDDAAATTAGTAVTIRVLAYDSGTSLAVASGTTPANGTARVSNNNRAVIYTPDARFTGSDSFPYTLRTSGNRTDVTTVSVTVRNNATSNSVSLGCFKDQGTIGAINGRDLNGFLLADRTGMTPALCNRTCGDRSYSFAGTQAGYQCFCGNCYGTFGAATNCTTACTGDATKKCGGTWANSVFDLR